VAPKAIGIAGGAMKRVAFIALGLLLFAGGVLAGRFSVREPARADRTEFERLEDRCLTDWAKVLAWATARGTALDFDPQSCRALKALYPKRPMMVAALAALLLLLVICDPGWRDTEPPPVLSPFQAFIKEHARCPGRREFGLADGQLRRWAACPCGGYLEGPTFGSRVLARRDPLDLAQPPAVQPGPMVRAPGDGAGQMVRVG
jgi:hypothetical protein